MAAGKRATGLLPSASEVGSLYANLANLILETGRAKGAGWQALGAGIGGGIAARRAERVRRGERAEEMAESRRRFGVETELAKGRLAVDALRADQGRLARLEKERVAAEQEVGLIDIATQLEPLLGQSLAAQKQAALARAQQAVHGQSTVGRRILAGMQAGLLPPTAVSPSVAAARSGVGAMGVAVAPPSVRPAVTPAAPSGPGPTGPAVGAGGAAAAAAKAGFVRQMAQRMLARKGLSPAAVARWSALLGVAMEREASLGAAAEEEKRRSVEQNRRGMITFGQRVAEERKRREREAWVPQATAQIDAIVEANREAIEDVGKTVEQARRVLAATVGATTTPSPTVVAQALETFLKESAGPRQRVRQEEEAERAEEAQQLRREEAARAEEKMSAWRKSLEVATQEKGVKRRQDMMTAALNALDAEMKVLEDRARRLLKEPPEKDRREAIDRAFKRWKVIYGADATDDEKSEVARAMLGVWGY